jgi:cobalt/nickel transport system permease protein
MITRSSDLHIPDGYLSPATCAVTGAVMVPVVGVACARSKRLAEGREAPLMALGAAYSFLVMMFNVPVPDGTTAHAVGGVLVAIVLGPWAAVVCVSVALTIQALFFGDGGVLALGANALNMAFVMPFAGHGVYRLLARSTSLTSKRRALAAGLGGYAGINAAALLAAIELGLQPTLFHSADGTPLYAPFHLSQTIPAMALAHLTVAGFAELALTAGIVAYLQRTNLPLLRINHRGVVDTDAELAPRPARPAWHWGLAGVAVMAALTPLGLLAPGGAYGEDAPADLDLAKYHLDAIPSGLARYSDFWRHTLLSDYGFASGGHASLGYWLSALIGVLAIGAGIFVLVGALRLLTGARRRSAGAGAT